MAAVGTGAFQSVEEVCSAWLKVTKTVEPDPHNAAVYDEYFANYRMLYQDLQSAFARQAGLVKRHMLSYWEKS